jgi:hypothetical protein
MDEPRRIGQPVDSEQQVWVGEAILYRVTRRQDICPTLAEEAPRQVSAAGSEFDLLDDEVAGDDFGRKQGDKKAGSCKEGPVIQLRAQAVLDGLGQVVVGLDLVLPELVSQGMSNVLVWSTVANEDVGLYGHGVTCVTGTANAGANLCRRIEV